MHCGNCKHRRVQASVRSFGRGLDEGRRSRSGNGGHVWLFFDTAVAPAPRPTGDRAPSRSGRDCARRRNLHREAGPPSRHRHSADAPCGVSESRALPRAGHAPPHLRYTEKSSTTWRTGATAARMPCCRNTAISCCGSWPRTSVPDSMPCSTECCGRSPAGRADAWPAAPRDRQRLCWSSPLVMPAAAIHSEPRRITAPPPGGYPDLPALIRSDAHGDDP